MSTPWASPAVQPGRDRSQAHSVVPRQLPGRPGEAGQVSGRPGSPWSSQGFSCFSPAQRTRGKRQGSVVADISALRLAGCVILDNFGWETQFPQL